MPPTCRRSNVNSVADTGNLRAMKRGKGTPLQKSLNLTAKKVMPTTMAGRKLHKRGVINSSRGFNSWPAVLSHTAEQAQVLPSKV